MQTTNSKDLELILGSGAEVFHSIRWRLEVPIASRSVAVASQPSGAALATTPTYAIELTTEMASVPLPSSSSFTAAAGAASATTTLKTRWLSCDYETLVNITKVIEDAQHSVRCSAAYRRIHKMVK